MRTLVRPVTYRVHDPQQALELWEAQLLPDTGMRTPSTLGRGEHN